jgi:uncharacterized cupredoxin-like copper-binding protein
MELKASNDASKRWGDLLGFGIVASIGLGFFTGGLQHFPDSPQRSLWVVPLGFFLSLLALYFSKEWRSRMGLKPLVIYTGSTGALVIAGAFFAASHWSQNPGDGHDHAHSHDSSPVAATADAAAIRNVVIEVNDNMRFDPGTWQAQQGEVLRLIVVNTGKVKHELVVGQARELAEHAKSMRQSKGEHHHHDNAVSVEPGQSAILMFTFDKAGEWGMACFEPGHYEAGMKGLVQVKPHT